MRVEFGLEETEGFFVYHLVDSVGDVVYVGMSTNILARLGTHRQDPRFSMVESARVFRHSTLEAMRAAEVKDIRRLRPRYNVIHNKDLDVYYEVHEVEYLKSRPRRSRTEPPSIEETLEQWFK